MKLTNMQVMAFFPLYIGWFCEQPGFLTWWTGVGGRNWSGTQTRSVVANQRGQKRDKDHQVKEKRRLIKGKDSDFFGKTLSVKFSWIFKKMKHIVWLVKDVHLNTHVLVTQTLVFMYNLHVHVRFKKSFDTGFYMRACWIENAELCY